MQSKLIDTFVKCIVQTFYFISAKHNGRNKVCTVTELNVSENLG